MDNELHFETFGADAYLMEDVPNPNYSFAKTELVERVVMDIYNRGSDYRYVNSSDAGYISTMYPYNNPALDIQFVSETADKVVFKVSGKDVVFSSISSEVNYYAKEMVHFELDYNGKKCVFDEGFELISEKTCKAELADRLEVDGYGDGEYDYESGTWVYEEYRAFFYELGNNGGHDFDDCLQEMIGGAL